MTKEELIKLSRKNLKKSKQDSLCKCYDEAFIKGYELSKKRIEELEAENAELEKENAKLRKVAEFQQSSNMNTHLENKKIKEVLAVGSMWNKHLNSQNKALEEERDKYRDMMFEQREQLTKAKKIIEKVAKMYRYSPRVEEIIEQAEQFLNSEVEK